MKTSKTAKKANFKVDGKFFYKFCAKKFDTSRLFFTPIQLGSDFITGGFYNMNNKENYFESRDIGLIIFIIVAGWLLLFHSGLFR